MCMTFFFWTRSVQEPKENEKLYFGATLNSYIFGFLSGLAYIYMVAAWGGFVFVGNLIAVHAVMLFVLGRYHSSIHRHYETILKSYIYFGRN